MTLDEIKQAVRDGYVVHWTNPLYRVIEDSIGQWLIECQHNGSCVGLTWMDGVTMNGRECEFYIAAGALQ